VISLRFPQIKGSNLNLKTKIIPEDLSGELNLIVMPFLRWQQYDVDSWVPSLQKMQKKYPLFRFYEIPTLSNRWKLGQKVIDGGMRAGIPDPATRQRTITVYVNKKHLKEQLNIETEENIHLFLVDKNQNILWRGSGPKNEETARILSQFLEKYFV
jgi:hypothetical protein